MKIFVAFGFALAVFFFALIISCDFNVTDSTNNHDGVFIPDSGWSYGLPPAILVSPLDGDYNLPLEFTFTWDTVPGATMYVVYVEENDNCYTFAYDTVLVNHLKLSNFKKGIYYSWSVYAYGKKGWSKANWRGFIACGCPSIHNDTLVIKGNSARFGIWRLNVRGYDGGMLLKDYSVLGVTLTSNCGWSVLGNYNGGGGNIFVATDSSCYFVWSWSSFCALTVGSQWHGQTPEGIHIGSSLADFKKAYSGFQYLDSINVVNCRETVNTEFSRPVFAHFDSDTLTWLRCGSIDAGNNWNVPGFETEHLSWPSQ
jgi:hypothetical protein